MTQLLRLCAVLIALWVMPAQAATVFDEDFEVTLGQIRFTGGATQPLIDLQAKGWGFIDSGVTAEIASIVSKTSRTGASSKAVRLRYGFMNHLPQATDFQNVKLTRFFPGVTEFWSRGYYRWEKIDPAQPSFWVLYPTMATSKQQYFNPGLGETVGGPVEFHFSWAPNELISSYATPFSRLCPGGTKMDQSCNYYPNQTRVPMTIHNSPTDRPTEWACVEAHWKGNNPLNTTNGLLELYVNGVLTTRYSDLLFFRDPPSGSQTNTFRYVQIYRQSAENMFRYEDDFGIGTTRLGCSGGGGTPPPVDTVPPPTPTNFAATVVSGSSATLTWTGVIDNGTAGLASYNIRGCTGAACVPSATVANVLSNVTSYSNTGLTASTTYGRSIAAIDANGNTSPYSSTIYFTTSSTFSELPGTDTFTRADATNIGTLWDAGYTGQTNLQIISQRLRGVTVNTRSFETYTGTVAPNDVYAQVTVASLAGAQAADICVPVRAANPPTMTGYFGCALRNGANTWEIREYATGTPTVLTGNATYDVVVGDKIRLEAEGTALRLYRERAGTRVLVASTTDATLASGKVGVSLFVATSGTLSNVEADDFSTGAISAGVPTLITHDSTSGSSITNTTASVSWNHTVGSGSNPLVSVCLYARGTVAGNTAVSNVSIGGIPATKVLHNTETNAGVTFRSEQWYAVGVPSGTHLITSNWVGPNAQYAVGTAKSSFGVSQTTPVDASNGSVSASSSTISTSITTVADHSMIMDCVLARDAPYTVGAGQTQRIQLAAFGDSQVISDVMDKTPAGAETMDGTQPTAEDYTHSVVSYKPATIVPPTPAVLPSITSVTAGLTGADVTFGATAPNFVRIVDDRPTPIIAPLRQFQPTAALRFTEAFTRADSGALGSNYVTTTGAGSHSINSNRLAVTAVNTFASNALTPVLGISNGMFTINGTETFLLGVSYFDVQEYTTSDLDTLAARGFNTVRVFANWDTSNAGVPGNEFGGNRAVCDSAGALIGARRDILQTFINEAKLRNMIVDMVILSLHDHVLLADDTARLACVTSVVNYYKPNLNVMFDVVQEHDTVLSPWTTANTAAESKTWTDAAFAACATCIIFNSATINNNGFGDFIGPNNTGTVLTTFNKANINTKLTTNGESVLGVHEARSVNWASVTGARVTEYRSYLSSIGKSAVPVIFDEPNRRVGATGPTSADFITAAGQARTAGAAMWVLHSDKNFDMRAQTFFQQLDSEETAFTTSVGSSMGLSSTLDQYIQAQFATFTNTNDVSAQLLVRMNPVAYTGYSCIAGRLSGSSFATIEREDGIGTSVDLTSIGLGPWVATDTFGCRVIGSHIVMEKNGVAILNATDAAYTTGNTGISGYITGGAVTDYTLDNIVSGTVASPYRYTWVGSIANLTFKCLHPQDAAGNENPDPNAYICVSLVGIAPTSDTDPIVISNPQPTGELPAGTTEREVSVDIDKPGFCRVSTTDIPYDQMTATDDMVVANLKASKLITGLTNGATITRYVGCEFTNQDDAQIINPTNTAVTFTIANSTADGTPPSTITNLACTSTSPTEATCAWPLATDNVAVLRYEFLLSLDGANFGIAGRPTVASLDLTTLIPGQTYYATVKAEDTSGNLSTAASNTATFTMPIAVDTTPPSPMMNLRQVQTFANAVVLQWDQCIDENPQAVTVAIIEHCAGANCTNFRDVGIRTSLTQTIVGLTSNTLNRFRGLCSDGANLGGYSNILDVPTATFGIGGPRGEVPFGVTRPTPATQGTPLSRPERP